MYHISNMHSAIPRRSPWILVPPPPLFVACFFGGMHLGRVLGIALPGALAQVALVAGACLAALGVLFVVPAPAMFAWTRTTIVPHGRARALVTSGPYRFTRNPMYVGLSLLYAGIALASNQIVALPFLALPIAVLSAKTIPYEEAMLEQVFGDEYRAYARRVRRWL
jgi:protein-S-isoprenylcysteine O-methyltransferase Ste14